jgi:hypothetical protein
MPIPNTQKKQKKPHKKTKQDKTKQNIPEYYIMTKRQETKDGAQERLIVI